MDKTEAQIMLKKILPIIIIIIVIAVLIPIYTFLIAPNNDDTGDFSNQKGSHGEMLSDRGRPFIIDPMSEDNIGILKVSNANGEFEFFRGDDNVMYLRGAEQHLYNPQLLKSLYSNAATYLLAIEKLESHDSLDTYGLTPEKASATIELTDTDGKYHKLYIGDKLATGAGYYAMLDGRDAVYVVDTMLETALFCSAQDFILPLMLPTIDQTDYTSISSFSLKKNGEPFIDIVKIAEQEESQSAIHGEYRMTFPAEYTPSAQNMTTILQSFIEFVADRVVDYDIDDAKLEYYGFKTGTKYELSYTYGGVLYTLYFGEKTQNGTFYVYSPLFDLIGEISASKVEFLEWDLIKYVDRNIFMININNISSIQIIHPNGSDEFKLTGEGDTLTVLHNGSKTDTQNFRYFYKSLLSIVIDGYSDIPQDTAPYMTLQLTTRSSQVLKFEFYETGSLSCAFTLNGKGEFYVHRDHLRTVISNLSKLSLGETIQ